MHRAWRTRWLLAQAALAVAGIVAFVAALRSGRPLELRPHPLQIPGYIALSLLAVAVHEMAHGLVVVHHDRKVSSVGFRLHLASPAFYVESVEALLLTRRQRMLQAAAGVWAEWQFTSLVALALWFAPTGAWTPILQRFVVLTAVTIASNLLPFAGLDGSLLLADLVREPDLAADAKRAARRRLSGERRAGDALLAAYAVANTIVSTALFVSAVWFWFLLFGGLLRSLTTYGPLGWVGAVALLSISFGPALAGAVPHLRQVRPVDRVAFRLERRSRIWFAEQFAATAPFDHLDDRSLSILAGQLHVRRVRRGKQLHVPRFAGHLMSDGRVEVGGTQIEPRGAVHVAGPGVTAAARRTFAHVRVGLLPDSALEVIGLAREGQRRSGRSARSGNRLTTGA